MRILNSLWAASLLVWAIPGGLEAQRALRGVLRDELRGRAVPGAEVVLVGSGLSTRTDSAGRFVFADVPTGALEVAHWGPWLDSLQLPPLRAAVAASGAPVDVLLSTPTFAAFHQARCGFPPQPGESILLGDLRAAADSDVPAVASASWTQLVVRGREVDRELRATVDSLSARGGGFALCGLPQGELITLHVSGGVQAGPLLVVPDAAIAFAGLVAAEPRDAPRLLRVRGRVLAGSSPATGASVEAYGDSTLRARTDSAGRFELAMPDRGSQTLLVRSIGRSEAWADVHPDAENVDLGDVRLADSPAALAPVVVEATWWERERQEFERRRRGANGYFVTDEMLRRIPQVSSITLAAMIPRLATERPGNSVRPMLKLRRGFAHCSPRFFEDGLDVGRLDQVETVQRQWDLIERAKRVEVYTANQAPPRFNDNDGCGVVVVWTR